MIEVLVYPEFQSLNGDLESWIDFLPNDTEEYSNLVVTKQTGYNTYGTTLASTGVTPLAYLCLPQVRWTQPALNRLETGSTLVRLALSRSVAPPLSISHQQISTAKHRSPAVDLPRF